MESNTMMQGDDPEHQARVRVFREHDEWSLHDRWFQMPTQLLRELYLETWDCPEEIVTPQDVAHIRAQYPHEVCLVYIGAPVKEVNADTPRE
jgi:hypothetical protein